ncbi:regulatory protein, ArsR [Catenulispora acidiphila DSM 44928]|uniref:Regulatory protein, ArsR n=1 Tax=Catenulispora acidiphila (strain DSM 44928 / JCM 14897 / NBRC 102108 / NRRL B-24433 / ID139908) TaxID=479433 RepID=C7PWB2_CATAD|nr:helix-turn-helix domain-containing protein [Catenulispora acidiphila]ACU73360.1 regulatory protein, ArsR [Catenulispora acidiphila DSM 44928]
MTDSEHDDVLHLNDPQAMRAYAHRTRMELVGLLRTEGPLTATRAAELTGESVASCSYHLRMLAKYGIVEEVPGPGRQKPWRATAQFTNVPRTSADPAVQAAATQLRTYFAQFYFEDVARAQQTADVVPERWRDAEEFGDMLLYLTPEELRELNAGVDALIDRYLSRNVAPETRPEGAELVQILRIAFRRDRQPDAEISGDAAPGTDTRAGTDTNADTATEGGLS